MTYADGTSGHSGSDTSQARAERERDNGTKSAREIETLSWLALAGSGGLTYSELGEMAGWHHGQSSSVLSNLHKDGRILRLTIRRKRSKIYVLPEYAGRYHGATEPHGGHAAERNLAIQRLEMIKAVIGDNMADSPGTLGRVYRIANGTAGIE